MLASAVAGEALIDVRDARALDDPALLEAVLKRSAEAAGATTSEGERSTPHRISTTEYRLNALPLGGYVKMLGQDDMDPTAVSDAPDSYQNCPAFKRMVVISAGVVMNMVSAAALLEGRPGSSTGHWVPGAVRAVSPVWAVIWRWWTVTSGIPSRSSTTTRTDITCTPTTAATTSGASLSP